MIQAVVFAARSWDRRLAGLKIIRRLVLSARAAGAQHVFILADRPDAVGAALAGLDPGTITLAASASELAPFGGSSHGDVLVLHDEVAVDPQYLAGLVEFAAPLRPGRAVLAVRDGPPPAHAMAAGVRLEGGHLKPAGQGAGLHTIGVALAPAALLAGISGDCSAAATTLRQRLDRLCSERAVEGYLEGRGYAALLQPDASWRGAAWEMIKLAGKPTDGVVSRLVNRKVSALVTAILVEAPIPPNAVTFSLLALGLVTGAVLLNGAPAAIFAGAALYQLNSALDGCDGELARLRFQTSRFGAWADSTCDLIVNLCFFVGVPLGLYHRYGGSVHLWLAALVVGGIVAVVPVVFIRSRRAGREGDFSDFGESLARSFRPRSFMASLVATVSRLLRRDAYVWVFLVLAAVGADELILELIAGGVALHLIAVLLPSTAKPKPAAVAPVNLA